MGTVNARRPATSRGGGAGLTRRSPPRESIREHKWPALKQRMPLHLRNAANSVARPQHAKQSAVRDAHS
jgi:hypothetical protein